MTDLNILRGLYDHHLRIEVAYPHTRRDLTPRTVRLIDTLTHQGTVIYSRLDSANAEVMIGEEIAAFKAQGITELEWKLFDYDPPADLKARLIAQGFVAEEPDAVLILELADVPPALLAPVTADVRRLTDPAQLADVRAVLEAVWPEDDQDGLMTSLAETLRTTPDELSVYCAYVDGDPACVAWIDIHAGNPFAGLWGGSTLPEYRQQGLYTALVAARTQEAIRRGLRFLTIDASPMSRTVLEKFGFRLLAYAWECNYRGLENG